MCLELNSFQERRAYNGLKANKNFIEELKTLKAAHWEHLSLLNTKKKKWPHFPIFTSQCIINIAVANDEPIWIHRHNQIFQGFGAALELRSHLLLSNGGNNGLSENILGQHLWLITVKDLQQVGPTTLIASGKCSINFINTPINAWKWWPAFCNVFFPILVW